MVVRVALALFVLELGFAGVAAALAATGPAHPLKDINPTPSFNRGSFPENYGRLGKLAFFQARTPQTGQELWRTDGTQAGTFLVKDIFPGQGGAFNYPGFYHPDDPFVELGGALLFLADDGAHGFELWRSDGTEAGTRMVREISSGIGGSFDARDAGGGPFLFWQHVTVGGTMYFLADDAAHGFELWRTDGTEGGTWMVSDILPGPGGAFGSSFSFTFPLIGADVGGTFFFRALDGIHGIELWKTDGTPAGTVQVKDIYPGPSGSYPWNLVSLNGAVLFAASDGVNGQELWKSDGTEAGTVLVKDIAPWPGSSNPNNLIRVNDTVYFTASNRLYKTDGSTDGTVPVRQFTSEVASLREWNGALLFTADDGIHGREVWRSDGTAGGTALVKDIAPGATSSPSFIRFTEAGSGLFFFAYDGVHGSELWRTDGTESGTFLVKDITPGSTSSNPYNLVGEEGALFLFVADADYPQALRLWKSDGTEAGTRAVQSPPAYYDGIGLNGNLVFGASDVTHGFELWKSDGTDAGTNLVKDIHPSFVTDSSYTQFMGVVSVPGVGERMFFSADDGEHGPELWVSDGTESGTRLVKDIYPGEFGSWPSPGIAHDGAIFFAATDDVHGYELWRSDGTEAGTALVADIFPGFDWGMQSDSTFGELGDSVYFAANDGAHGRTLWKSNGTQAGTIQVAEVDLRFSFPNLGSPSIYPITIGGTLYFVAWEQAHGVELWKSDGTEAGTVRVRDIAPGSASSGPSMFADFNGSLFMVAEDPVHGYEPWLSDGTDAGTYLIKDIYPGRTASHRRAVRPVVLGDSIFFPARLDGTQGDGLWKTDGTEAGTLLVKDVRPGVRSIFSDPLTLLDGTLYFIPNILTSPGTYELWKSDGTEEGTLVVKAGLSHSSGLLAVEGRGLVFASNDDDHGYELWRSDGTESGTVMAQDISSGPDSSVPYAFTPFGNSRVLFLADDGIAGPEPWVARTAILFGRPDQAIADLKGEVMLLRLPLGIETSLNEMLDAAAGHLAANRTAPAILSLEAFGRHLSALSPGKVSAASAADLQTFTEEIVSLLEAALKPVIPGSPTVTEVPGNDPARVFQPAP